MPPAQGGLPVPVEDYAWDEEGNRTASHLSGLYAANAHNQLLEDDDFTYAHDARGNQISRTAKATGAVTSYLYDARNRLIGVEGAEGLSSYRYDAMGRRIAVTPAGGVQAVFVYDTWNPRSAITDEVALEFTGGALVKRWLHGPRVDEPLGFERYTATTAPGSGTAHELIADRLGSVLGVVDVATGQLAGDYRYDAFGARSVTGEAIRYGFTGREHDASGLIYYRARHFDPQTGRFLQPDPIGFAAGDLNIYAYVWNDPFNWTDPSGLSSESSQWARLASAAVVAGRIGKGTLKLAAAIQAALTAFDIANLAADVGRRGAEEIARDLRDFIDELDLSDCTVGDGDTSLYEARNADGSPEYVGITDDEDRRRSEHARQGRRTETRIRGMTREQGRIVEQIFISGERNRLSNLRNAISPRHFAQEALLEAAKRILENCKR